jgi:hypothetical protein
MVGLLVSYHPLTNNNDGGTYSNYLFQVQGHYSSAGTKMIISRDLHDFSNLLLPLHLYFLFGKWWSFNDNLTQTTNLEM